VLLELEELIPVRAVPVRQAAVVHQRQDPRDACADGRDDGLTQTRKWLADKTRTSSTFRSMRKFRYAK
jgi:chloramphenicol 3-O-phosphotransferase